MQCCGINLDSKAGRNPKGLHKRGVQLSIHNLALFCQKKDEIAFSDVDLTVPVVLKAVELCVVSPAHSELDGHSTESSVAV